MLNYAHRGFKEKFPENTMLAYKKALEYKADGIELDVHLSKDGELVIIHDENLLRTCGEDSLVKDKTLSELKKLNASFDYEEYKEEIPTLREYFDFIKTSNLITNIEIKNGLIFYQGIEEKIYNMIKEYDLKDRVIISSFNHESIMRMKEIDETLKLGFLEESVLANPIKYLKDNGISYFHPLINTINKDLVKMMHDNGIKVNAWMSSKQKYDYLKYLDYDLDGIITDNPEKIYNLTNK
ncbi:glycerophosphodiester phosphodiesterase [Anaerococcus sp. AGMB00486]|uniref:Glycerophosphodiester phosphodiesterase n=2 Tax=Anaerococcus TaxID=165779 RepID=A0ABX2NBK4_9FIRM|nr:MULTISPECIES: glycerophosphodiester phosphodiesterase [Anaerococcus]MDY3006626.1 glycerophosphodiester phosphodiesterase [Anaerococcus porci]MSS78095.1 glycerophosphodiester phosphodiesterase [Anaerococcus porci]NVF12101.1 glycerophosphodiester phosphodiesterase [Anaerococcus faecalis]